MNDLNNMLKGVLEGCVMEIISHEEAHGYEIARRLNELGFTDVVVGTINTVLNRLEKKELVVSSVKSCDLGPSRRFYILNDAGHEELQQFWKRWKFLSTKLGSLQKNHV